MNAKRKKERMNRESEKKNIRTASIQLNLDALQWVARE